MMLWRATRFLAVYPDIAWRTDVGDSTVSIENGHTLPLQEATHGSQSGEKRMNRSLNFWQLPNTEEFHY
jgi:hypothetical protein